MCWELRVDLGGSPTKVVHVRGDGFKLRHRVGSVTDSGGRVALVLTKRVGSMEFAPTDFQLLSNVARVQSARLHAHRSISRISDSSSRPSSFDAGDRGLTCGRCDERWVVFGLVLPPSAAQNGTSWVRSMIDGPPQRTGAGRKSVGSRSRFRRSQLKIGCNCRMRPTGRNND